MPRLVLSLRLNARRTCPYADGRIYTTDKRGSTPVFAAGPTYEYLATNRLDEPTNASIAISGCNILIRTHKHLWSIGEK